MYENGVFNATVVVCTAVFIVICRRQNPAASASHRANVIARSKPATRMHDDDIDDNGDEGKHDSKYGDDALPATRQRTRRKR